MGEAAVGVEAAHAAPLEGVVAAAGLGVVAARETLAGGRLGLGFALTLGRPSNWPGAPPPPFSPQLVFLGRLRWPTIPRHKPPSLGHLQASPIGSRLASLQP